MKFPTVKLMILMNMWWMIYNALQKKSFPFKMFWRWRNKVDANLCKRKKSHSKLSNTHLKMLNFDDSEKKVLKLQQNLVKKCSRFVVNGPNDSFDHLYA